MSSTQNLLDELVADARRVAAYGQRTGRLKDNELISSIWAVDNLNPATWKAPEVATMQAAMNRALQVIYPTSLVDLRSNWDPFDKRRTLGPLLFVLATLALMFITAVATFEYDRGVGLLKGIEALEKDDPRAEIGSIARQLIALNAAAKAAEGQSFSLIDEAHFALIDRLHQIDGRLEFYIPEMSKFRVNHPLPHETIGASWLQFRDGFGAMLGWSAVAKDAGAAVAVTNTDPIGVTACKDRDKAEALYLTTFARTPVAGMLAQYFYNVLDIVCAQNLKFPPGTIGGYAGFIADMTNWSNMWGLWYLPALYGALGAMLYYMRRILDPTIPDPPAIRILHRTALGAFSGVVVTWFWAPDQLETAASSVGLTVLTLAFLVGFGIEVLFALLDRLVTTLIELAKGGTAPPSASATVVVAQPPPAPGA